MKRSLMWGLVAILMLASTPGYATDVKISALTDASSSIATTWVTVCQAGSTPTTSSCTVASLLGSAYVATGDILYASAAKTASALTAGSQGQMLRMGATIPAWSTNTWPNTVFQGGILYGSAANTYSNLAVGTAGNPLITGGAGANPSWLGVVMAGGTNTFSITNGTASLDVAAGAALNIDTSLTVQTAAVTLTGKSGGSTLTLPTAISLDGTMADGKWCSYASSGTVLSCNQTAPQATNGTPAGFVIASQAQGDILYASSATAWARLGAGSAGSLLKSGGAAANPAWTTETFAAPGTAGGILYSDGTNWARLAPPGNSYFLGYNSSGTFGAYQNLSMDDTAAQFYGKTTSHTGSLKIDLSTSTPATTISLLGACANDCTLTLPSATATIATLAGSESLTNKKLGSLTTNGFVTTGSSDGTLSVTVPGSGVATWIATPSSANLATAVTDETGSGALVFGTSPAITTDLHAATAGGATVGTNALPFSGVRIGNAATNNILLTGTSAGDVTVTLPSTTSTLATVGGALGTPSFTALNIPSGTGDAGTTAGQIVHDNNDTAGSANGNLEWYDGTNVRSIIDTGTTYTVITKTEFLPIRYAEDGTTAPDAAAAVTGKKIIARNFAEGEDVVFFWVVPNDYVGGGALKYRVHYALSTAGEADDTATFSMTGCIIADAADIACTAGTALTISDELTTAYAQYEYAATAYSAESNTDWGAAAGGLVKLGFSYATAGDYAHDVLVIGIELKYKAKIMGIGDY